jgi:HEAT repeat protein
MSDPSTRLEALFDAERAVRRTHDELLASDRSALVPALCHAARSALDRVGRDAPEAALRLTRISALLGEVGGSEAVDTLIDILASEEPEARHAAGEELEELAFARFKEVALGIERALGRLPAGNVALSELPYLLAEVPEPGATKLLGRFLAHSDENAVAAAIEALVETGDPTAARMLEALEKDTRQVDLDEDGESGRVSIGDLATEARELLLEMAEQTQKRGPR